MPIGTRTPMMAPLLFASAAFFAAGCSQPEEKVKPADAKKADGAGVQKSDDGKKQNKEEKQTDKVIKPDFSVTATDLGAEFEADRGKADKKYKGKIVEVTGEVFTVKPRPFDKDVAFALKAEKGGFVMFVTYPDQNAVAAKLSRKKKVKVYADRPFDFAVMKIVEIDKSTVILVGASDLAKEFQTDRVAAEKKYCEGADIIVSGKVEDTAKDGDLVAVKLAGDEKMRVSVGCGFLAGAEGLKKGQTAHFRVEQLLGPPQVRGNEVILTGGTVVDLK